MKRMPLVCVLVVGCLPLRCEAQPFGKIAHYMAHHKEMILADAVIIAAWSADAASTVHDQHVCPACVETNPFLSAHPSTHAVWLVGMGSAGTEVTLQHLLWHYAPETGYHHLAWVPAVIIGSTEAKNVWGNVQAGKRGQAKRSASALLRESGAGK